MADNFMSNFQQYEKNLKGCNLTTPPFGFFCKFIEEDKNRHYHGTDHIDELRKLHSNLHLLTNMRAEDAVAVDMAIWWHDLIYTVGSKNNEWLSAQLFKHYYKPSVEEGYPIDLVGVYYTILNTEHGKTPYTGQPWALYFADLDLAGLGSDFDTFTKNSEKIMMESLAVGTKESKFVKGRIAFFEHMLNLGRPIFYNPYALKFFADAEVQAVNNIKRELEILKEDLTNFN